MPVVVQNRSKTPCHLAGFEINVVINGRLRWTKRAGGEGEEDRFPGWDLTDGRASKRVVRFPGLSRTEVDELLQAPGGLDIAIDIPAASLDIRRYTEPRQRFPLEQVVAKCAVLDLAAPEARRLYVSAIAEDGATGLPLEEFLNRVTPGSAITWKSGPTGDYLALFQDKPGTDLPLPNLRSRGMWLIDWISGSAASTSAPQRLSGSIRNKLIRPGDEIHLRYISAAEYWEHLDRWKGYVAVYQDWRDLAKIEHEFWEIRCAKLDRRDPKALRAIAEKADRLLSLYEEFFDKHRANEFIAAVYPDAEQRLLQFKRWFPGDRQVVVPSLHLRFRVAAISGEIPSRIKPYLVINTGAGDSVSHRIDMHKKNEQGPGGELTTDQPIELIWSPGDPVEVSLHDNNLLGDDTLLRVQGTGFYAATALLRQHKNEEVDGIDPNLSHLEIYLDLDHEGRRVALRGERQNRLIEYLDGLRPRVIDIVPTDEVDPQWRAFDLFLAYDPASHHESALLFEQLYRRSAKQPASLEMLARAVHASFLAFDFDRCIELGRLLPTDVQMTPDVAKSLPRGKQIAYYREMVAATQAASDLDGDGEQFRVFARFILHWHRVSQWRLLVRKRSRGETTITVFELNQHRDALLRRLKNHQETLASIRPPALKDLMKNWLTRAEDALRHQGAKQSAGDLAC